MCVAGTGTVHYRKIQYGTTVISCRSPFSAKLWIFFSITGKSTGFLLISIKYFHGWRLFLLEFSRWPRHMIPFCHNFNFQFQLCQKCKIKFITNVSVPVSYRGYRYRYLPYGISTVWYRPPGMNDDMIPIIPSRATLESYWQTSSRAITASWTHWHMKFSI